MKKISFLIIVVCGCLSTQCDDDVSDDPVVNLCDNFATINEDIYMDIETSNYILTAVTISDDCLSVTFGSSGCSGNTWTYSLVDSGAVAESLPEQRFLKFNLDNQEDCAAAFERTFSFNLKPLQIEGSNEIILNLEGWGEPINYSY